MALQSWLTSETEIVDAIGGISAIAGYLDMFKMIALSTPESVSAILKVRNNKRKQMSSLQELQLLLTKKQVKTEDEKIRLSFLTDEIRSLEQSIGYDPLAKVVTGFDISRHAEDIWELPDFLPTQFQDLNRSLGYDPLRGGFVKGAVSSILAQSSMGKSTLTKTLCNYWLDQGNTVLFINFEEARAHWERILMTQVTGKNVYVGLDDLAERNKYTKIFMDKMEEWGDRFMVRHDPDTSYFEDLEIWLRDIIGHNQHIPDVVVIDTIQSLQIKAGGKQRWGEYEQMMIKLERLAKDMNCVMIITAQENSNRMKEKREVVQQSDAGGSLTIMQKSTVAIFITQKMTTSGDDSIDESIMQIQIPKNRITGTAFTNNAPLLKYNDNTKSFESYEPVFAEWDNKNMEI